MKKTWAVVFLVMFMLMGFVKFSENGLNLFEQIFYFAKAKSGNIRAIKKLHNYYAFNLPNKTLERYWLEQGASSGDAEMQYLFGIELVSSTEQQHQKAGVDWLRSAANSEYSLAQMKLAELYEQGKVLPLDLTACDSWYHKAAFNGEPAAMLKLADFAENGVVRKTNLVEAYAWLILTLQFVSSDSAYAKHAQSEQQKILGLLRTGESDDIDAAQKAAEMASNFKNKIKRGKLPV